MAITEKPMHRSHDLNGDTAMLVSLYRDWAPDYDHDVLRDGYTAPWLTAQMITMTLPNTETATVLDVGCGTGLVGRELKRVRGGLTLIGLDLSPEMAAIANQTGAYDRAVGDINLLSPSVSTDAAVQPANHVVCCGTLTNGHIGPEGIGALLALTAPNGHLTFSVRLNHSRAEDFAGAVHRLTEGGAATLTSALFNAPYIGEEGADYFTLRKPTAA
ncbi:class I SAM-dependent methyltransferase [Tsukamurella sp. 8F]|uniref:class I SAM-dependent DNA methyltransferase n=1 Tax=unclassified Tsukamurella TaxID=2633480 RepID=UPI0023BA3940|nr:MULTISPECIES: class I SAM-dependent methyltransferase [unclassified Tsukamurella]MDF0528654.1 class I SAM-dependent methyltransferase [Tsukamurella sp. 8J]MDF0585616.1 class I SAM-dependent methyltransferase [Tsukamurella sp. 8F]